MPYYNNDDRYYNNGHNNRRSDRGNGNRNRSWGNGYDDRDRDMMPRPFEINQPVRHIATGVRLTVIRYGREQVECRKPDLSSEYFYLYELEAIPEGQQ